MLEPVNLPNGVWRELVLGGQKSGKSRRAETLTRQWLDASPQHRAVMVATAQAWDDEMRQRIARHQTDRAQRLPGMETVESSRDLASAIRASSAPQTLVVVDCLTLWLTQWLMPMEGTADTVAAQLAVDDLVSAVRQSPGPVVLVSNEIGLGVIPMGREVRAFVDAQGLLNQAVAQVCERVSLVAAGCAVFLKGAA